MNQRELPLPFPELAADLPLMPVRMVNEYEYCPRLAYLEWVQGEWADSGDTVTGRRVHKRVDKPAGPRAKALPESGELEEDTRIHARSITLSSNRLGLITKMDLIEAADGAVIPIDYKKGKRPHVPKGAYSPERIQVCAQGLILREHGYQCEEGALYFAASKERVPVVFDDDLLEATQSAINGLRLVAAGGQIPPPLEDSPKCPRCSLVGICLPDEVSFLNRADTPPRRLAVGLTEALPMIVQDHRAKVTKDGERLVVKKDDKVVAAARLGEVSQLQLHGNVYVTTPTLHALMEREIPISWSSYGGWFKGYTAGIGHKNVELRTAQYKASFDEQLCARIARGLVVAKIRNQRTLLRRNWRGDTKPDHVLSALDHAAKASARVAGIPSLLGTEGTAAAAYFSAFDGMLRKPDGEGLNFEFSKRNRRPPGDPVNALLSFAYAMLTRAWTIVLASVGFDPYRGFYHQPRYGRPALALDMMEPFRPLIADSAVLQAINNGEVRPTDFVSAAGSVNLNTEGRKRFIATFERRMSHEVTHPIFGYKVSYRRLLEVQARLLGRALMGEIPEYPNFTTR